MKQGRKIISHNVLFLSSDSLVVPLLVIYLRRLDYAKLIWICCRLWLFQMRHFISDIS